MDSGLDYRFSLANERTYLAWIRTALGLIVGGLVAAKALRFHHDVLRWAVTAPPIVAGLLVALEATRRWRRYEETMRAGTVLAVGRFLTPMAVGVAAYAAVVLVASAIDG